MKNKPFYLSVEWNILASKTHDPKIDDESGYHNDPCVDKNTCANIESDVECDDKLFFGQKCKNKRITMKFFKNAIMLKDK